MRTAGNRVALLLAAVLASGSALLTAGPPVLSNKPLRPLSTAPTFAADTDTTAAFA